MNQVSNPPDTVAVHGEYIGSVLIKKWIEVDGKYVIAAAGLVTVTTIRAHDAGVLVVCVESQVDVCAVVGHVDVSGFTRGCAIQRCLLDKVGNSGCGLPRHIIESTVDGWRCCCSVWTHSDSVS